MEDPKQKLYDEIKECKKEIENKTKENNDLRNKLDNLEIDSGNELEAQTEYFNNMIEGYKISIEDIKKQKGKAAEDSKKEIEKLEIEIGNYKCELANIQFDMDRKLLNFKKYVKKLQLNWKVLDLNLKINI